MRLYILHEQAKYQDQIILDLEYVPTIPNILDLRTDLQNNKTTKQEYFCFLDDQYYFEKSILVSPFPNKIVQQESNTILGEILVSLFSCFVNPFSEIFCTYPVG